MDSPPKISVLQTAWQWWTYAAAYEGYFAASRRLLGVLWEFVRDSTPERLRQRYGDADYDWDNRVNTTSGGVGWRDRLLGMFHSAYQPTEPAAFHEMIEALQLDALQQTAGPGQTTINFRDFTFIDLGSGKGRTLLMAADYPFGRIIGVELLLSLHKIAQKDPLVIFLFNPFPESGMRRVVANLSRSLHAHPRPVFVLYHNPLLEYTLGENAGLRKIAEARQYSIFSNQ